MASDTVFSFVENDYWNYMDFTMKIRDWLIKEDMVLVGLYNSDIREWFDCHCVKKKDVIRPYQTIELDDLRCSPSAMKELFAYGFAKAMKDYLDRLMY